ncbi:helix-turn-helix domain-containing protein [Scytonema tolypothrichoides VB-61278]|nr:helix-turn-helix domain-containing protein [Scytonema tolypothrichoides VB-61278]
MNKQEAAEFLEVSVRALERYVQQGKISVKYQKGKTRSIANFDPVELESFKTELNQPTFKPSVETRQPPTDNHSRTRKDVLYSGDIAKFGEVGDINGFSVSAIDKLCLVVDMLLDKPLVPISDKVLLKLSEVQALTGLSKNILRAAIKEKKLKAQLIGKSWRIKRADVDEYIASLY